MTASTLISGLAFTSVILMAYAQPTQKERWIAVETIVGKTIIVKADGGTTTVWKAPKMQERVVAENDCKMPRRVRAADGRCYLKSRMP